MPIAARDERILLAAAAAEKEAGEEDEAVAVDCVLEEVAEVPVVVDTTPDI